MAKKKSNKKESKKKDEKKKKLIKLKLKKKKAKKKEAKKKEAKKKDIKKKEAKKKSNQKLKVDKTPPGATAQPKASTIKEEDHSSNYNVSDAVKKLRSLKSKEELLSFTKGEKRLTVTRIIPAALNRLN